MHQFTYQEKNNTIHSSPQIEYYKNVVYDKYIKLSDIQCMNTLDKHKITISLRNDFHYVSLRPSANDE